MASGGNAGPRDEMGQIESDVPYEVSLEEEGHNVRSGLVCGHFSAPVSRDSYCSHNDFEVRVREVMECIAAEKETKREELKKVEWEKKQTQDQLALKEEELRLFKEKYDLHMGKAKEESQKELIEKDKLLKEKDEKIKELTLDNDKLNEEMKKLTSKNSELQQRVASLQKEIQTLNQSMTTMQNENEAIRTKVDKSVSKEELDEILKQVHKTMDERLAEMIQSTTLKVPLMISASDGSKVRDYKPPHKVSPSHSPSRSPVNVENNNLNVSQ